MFGTRTAGGGSGDGLVVSASNAEMISRAVRVESGPTAASVISPCLPGARSAWTTTRVPSAASIQPSTCGKKRR